MKNMCAGKKIIRRCAWCVKKHRMDDSGNPVPGYAGDDAKGIIFSDGVCKKAEAIMDRELDMRPRS